MKKQIHIAEVLENREIAPGIRRLEMYSREVSAAAEPGQFLNLYPAPDRLILPRPFGIHDVSERDHSVSLIYEIVGEGTQHMAELVRGDRVRLSEPLGNGFDLREFRETADEKTPESAVLIGGGVGVSVLQLLARRLRAMGHVPTVIMGFRQTPFAVEEMEKLGCRVMVTTDVPHETAFLGNVCECMELNGISGDRYFACGPHPMLKAVEEFVRKRGDSGCLQVSLDGRMGCGYGVCLGCSVPMKQIDPAGNITMARKRVCKDGPVFRGNEVVW